MKTKERVELVRAMETVARSINHERIFEGWLMYGVADGDINEETTDEELEYYIEDDVLKGLIGCFLRCMEKASRNGGLYIDGIAADRENV